jgi:hypothetical protein
MNKEILEQAELGLAGNVDEWKSALCALMADRDVAERMGELAVPWPARDIA